MGKLVVTEFISLDGVFEDPGGAENYKYGGWSFKVNRGPAGDKFKMDELLASDAQLLGRVTYQEFAGAWPTIKDEAGFADKMNSMPKYVVSTTLTEKDLTWNKSKLLKGDLAEAIAKLKSETKGDILTAGSGQLVRSLMQAGLVDEFRLMVYPVVLGEGKRLFEGALKTDLKLASQQKLGDGIILLTYRALSAKI